MPQGYIHKNMDAGSQSDSGTPSLKMKDGARGGAIESGTPSPSLKITAGENDRTSPIQWSYPGGKNGAGVYQRLINWIPPHRVYIEPFLGSGGIMLNKKYAQFSYGYDIDFDVITKWAHFFGFPRERKYSSAERDKPTISVQLEDAVLMLLGLKSGLDETVFIFCDPPYIMETRSSPGRIYKYEYAAEQHVELLKLLASLKCMVMITGYRHPIYDDALSSWRRMDYKTPTRGGLKDESCWMNYPEPTELHDYRYLGTTFKKREQIKLKQQRWLKRLNNMPVLEKNAMLEALNRPA